MRLLSTILATFVAGYVSSTYGQILNYTPSKGNGVSYRVNIPHDTASTGSGPIYLQIKSPSNVKWVALGQGSRMRHGNLFVVYSAAPVTGGNGTGNGNVTLSPRRATGPYEPSYCPDIDAHLLQGSGISDGTLTANIRCDSCMMLHDGNSIMSTHSQWIWAIREGTPLNSNDVSRRLRKHHWHGIFSLDLALATGGGGGGGGGGGRGNADEHNPFLGSSSSSYKDQNSLSIIDYTSASEQEQTSDIRLRQKRIAHGSLTALTFVLFFPNIGLILYIFPSRRTVAWIHAPLQIFATLMALGGLLVGVSISKDLHDVANYHPVIGYITILGLALFQPILGIVQHLRFRRTGQKTLYGLAHRYLGRFLCVLGVINGGLGFHYASSKTPRIPLVSWYLYGFTAFGEATMYVFVVWWKRSKDAKSRNKLESHMIKGQEKSSNSSSSSSTSESGSLTTTTTTTTAVSGDPEKIGVKVWSS